MKKYILILFSIISLWSCKETEDESIDITVLPSWGDKIVKDRLIPGFTETLTESLSSSV